MTTNGKPPTYEAAKIKHFESAKRFAELDAKLIDASASLEELQNAHRAAAETLAADREAMILARTPPSTWNDPSPERAVERVLIDDLAGAADAAEAGLNAFADELAGGHAIRDSTPADPETSRAVV